MRAHSGPTAVVRAASKARGRKAAQVAPALPRPRRVAGGSAPSRAELAETAAGRLQEVEVTVPFPTTTSPPAELDVASRTGGAGLAPVDSEPPSEWEGPLTEEPPPLFGLSPRLRGLALLNLLTLLFGSNVAIVKAAQDSLGCDPLPFAAGRFAIAALALSPFLPATVARPRLRAASLELGLLAALGYGCQSYALTLTTAGHVAFLGAFTVLGTPLLTAWGGLSAHPRPVPPRTWGAIALALAGVGVLEAPSGGTLHLDSALLGDAAALASAALFAAQLVRTERYAGARGFGPKEAAPLVAGQLATLALLFGGATAVSGGLHVPDGAELAALPWLPLVWTGLVSTAGSLWLEVTALRDVSAPDAALVYATEPVWGAAIAGVLLGETWTAATVLGAVLIVGGSLLGQLGEAESVR